MSTKFQYLHVNSSMRSKSGSNGEDAKLEINMSGHEIKDVKSVAVKQFTINNSSFNITSHKDTLKFAIVRKKADGTIDYKRFTLNIPNGYYQSVDLIGTSNEGPTSIINSLILEIDDRKVMSESSSFSLSFMQDPDTFRVSIKATVGSGNTGSWWFVPVKSRTDTNDGLWLDFGFDASHLTDERDLSVSYLEENLTMPRPGFYEMYSSYASGETTYTAANPTTIENIQGLYLTSDVLSSGSTYQTNNNNGHLQAKPCNILEFIQCDKEHYSTISYQPQHLHYHYINGKSLSQIDIGLTNHNGQLYRWNEIGRFHLILVFEIELNDEISKEFIKLYNQEGYEKAHTADKLILRKR